MAPWIWTCVLLGAKWLGETIKGNGDPTVEPPQLGGRIGMFRWLGVPVGMARAFAAANPRAFDATAFFEQVQDVAAAHPQYLPGLKTVVNAIESVVRFYPEHAVFVWLEK